MQQPTTYSLKKIYILKTAIIVIVYKLIHLFLKKNKRENKRGCLLNLFVPFYK